MEARQCVEVSVLAVFRPFPCQLRGFVAQKICVRTAFFRNVAQCLVRVRTQQINEEMRGYRSPDRIGLRERDRKSTRLNSSHVAISYAVFCLKKKAKVDAAYDKDKK